MNAKQDLVIVLRSVQFQDRHRIVTGLSENYGLITALAKNSVHSRRFGGTLDPFCASTWNFSEKRTEGLVFLQETTPRKAFENIRAHLEALATASAFNEILLRVIPEGQPVRELFILQSHALVALDRSPNRWLTLLNAFVLKILSSSGHPPQFHACCDCEKKLSEVGVQEGVFPVLSKAAWVCSDCKLTGKSFKSEKNLGLAFESLYGLKLTPATIAETYGFLTRGFQELTQTDLLQTSDEELRELFAILYALLRFHLPGFDSTPLFSLKLIPELAHLSRLSENPIRGLS